MLEEVKARAQVWLDGNYDEKTKTQVRHLLENDETGLIDSFYKDLEFGTGGLRGIMGVGDNRMNVYTVGMATQGLCNYLKKNFADKEQISVAIAYDNRNNGPLFCQTAADIFSANDVKVYVFDALRPTPELSFAIRHLGCQSGIVITASHNPKEYNGYKAYWEDGAQVIAPHDVNIVNEARSIKSIDEVKWEGKPELIETIGAELDDIYLGKIKELSLSPEVIERQKDMKIVYTPIHGTGVKLVPDSLKAFGFKAVYNVPEQDVVDGNFPTVISPNPENAEALTMALSKAKEVDAELVMATDPDSDRVGIAVKDDKNEWILLNGNQTASLLLYYLFTKWQENGKLTGKEYMVKTIVTSELLVDIAKKYEIDYHDTLTGFKFIAEMIRLNEGKRTFIGGGEESYGYLAGEFVRDKDAIMSCALIAETAAWVKDQGKSMYEMLLDIYIEFGLYKEQLVNVVKEGKAGADAIQQMMVDFRSNAPETLGGEKVVEIRDYQTSKASNKVEGTESDIDLPKSNVLQFFTEGGSKISVRPSGTEPKIKFYFSVKGTLPNKEEFVASQAKLDELIEGMKKDLGL